MCSRIRAALKLQTDVPAAWLFANQTIRELAAKVAAAAGVHSTSRSAALPLAPAVHSDAAADRRFPLSYQQEQFFLLWQRNPKSAAYSTAWGMHFSGSLDLAALQAALDLVVQRHEVSQQHLDCSVMNRHSDE